MLSHLKKIHFIGIGGIGMSGIAELLHKKGFIISGSDISNNSNIERLQKMNIQITTEHLEKNIAGKDLVVYSDAIPFDNCELLTANKQGILCFSRAKMLSEISKMSKATIAISGTHGKTTTTSMIGTIVKNENLNPTVIVGGVVKSFQTNTLLGSGDTFIVEADEYNRTFLHLSPSISVINNIDFEHIDTYQNLEDLKEAFVEFANSTQFHGIVAICSDSENAKSIIPKIDKTIITYGIHDKNADFRAEKIFQKNGKVSFEAIFRNNKIKVRLNIPGEHNILNALAALVVCDFMGLNLEHITKSLNEFSGVNRRFDFHRNENQLMIIDDYAHHPVEVKFVIDTIKKNWNRRLITIFQPHLFSRTKQFYKDFAKALKSSDVVLITEIFASREKLDKSVTSKLIVDEMKKIEHNNVQFVEYDNVKSEVKKLYRSGDIILTAGAGNIWRKAIELNQFLIKND
jgi:UDP-N-acetylmuramate--alanine ligase